MSRSKIAAVKIFKKVRLGKEARKELSPIKWKEMEGLLGKSLSDEVRGEIDLANEIFAMVGPFHSKDNTTSVARATSALNEWIKASGRLRHDLGEKTSSSKLSRAEIIAMFYGENAIKKIGKKQPLAFVDYVLTGAIGAALTAIDEMTRKNLSAELKGDMWLAWVRIIALALEQAGVKTSASSSNKVIRESPFVTAIMCFQDRLPKECHRYNGYESVAKGAQLAKRKLGDHNLITLRAILTGWGFGILPDYSSNSAAVEVDKLLGSKPRLRQSKQAS